jgi:hypothetical protein
VEAALVAKGWTAPPDGESDAAVVRNTATENKQAIWRGSCSGEVSRDPHPDGRKVQEAVTEMFNGFPPSD